MHDGREAAVLKTPAMAFSRRYFKNAKGLYLLVALVIVFVFFTAMNPRFSSVDNLINIARQMSINMVIAVGMTLVIISGGLDLSVGAIAIMCGCLVGVLMAGYDVPIIVAIVIGLFVGGLAGYLNGYVIAKFRVPPFVATLAMMSIARGVAIIETGGYIISNFPAKFNQIGIGFFLGIPFPVYVMVIVVIVGHIVLSKTEFGLNVYALGGNERAARLAGLKVDAMKLKIYTISGVLSAIGGILLTARVVSAQPALMVSTNLEVIAAVFVGGTRMGGGEGGMLQTVMGAVLMAFLFNGLNIIGVGYEWQQVAIGVILIGAVGMDMRSTQQSI
jgi:ribose transport system permease protein